MLPPSTNAPITEAISYRCFVFIAMNTSYDNASVKSCIILAVDTKTGKIR